MFDRIFFTALLTAVAVSILMLPGGVPLIGKAMAVVAVLFISAAGFMAGIEYQKTKG